VGTDEIGRAVVPVEVSSVAVAVDPLRASIVCTLSRMRLVKEETWSATSPRCSARVFSVRVT
jgi:hypothetical protein